MVVGTTSYTVNPHLMLHVAIHNYNDFEQVFESAKKKLEY